jgi:hypothetical protein
MNTGILFRPRALFARPSARSDVEASTWRNNAFWLLVVLVAAGLLCLPFIHTVRGLGDADEGVTLLGADRLLHGDRLYVDFFEFLPPGSFLIMAGWFAAIGTSLWSARCLAILVIAGIACLTYLTCRQVSKNAAASALIALAWLITSPEHGYYVQISHHWFATLFSMISAWAVLAGTGRERRWLRGPLLAGLAAGAAAMIVPTRGVAAVLAAATAYLDLRRQLAEAVCFVLACAVAPLCLLGYIAGYGGLLAAYEDVIVFPANNYLSVQGITYGHGAYGFDLVLPCLFPLAGLLALIVTVTTWGAAWRDGTFRTCIAFGLAGWVGFLPRPDLAHIYWSAPLACPLISYCASSLMRRWRPIYRYVPAVAVIVICLHFARAYTWEIQRALRADVVSTPRGEVTYSRYIVSGTGEAITWLAAAPPHDGYFFYPYMEMLPFLVARQQVSRYDQFIPEYTTPAQYRETCLSVLRHASWIVIDRTWAENPRQLVESFSGIHNASPPEVRKFEQALDDSYEPVERFGVIEIRHRRRQVNEASCADISR